jgi:hypothetical protein
MQPMMFIKQKVYLYLVYCTWDEASQLVIAAGGGGGSGVPDFCGFFGIELTMNCSTLPIGQDEISELQQRLQKMNALEYEFESLRREIDCIR